MIISTVQWFVDGRKNFTGPRTDMGLEVLEAVHEQPTCQEGVEGAKMAEDKEER